ncbi:hypothetical protein GCM10009098_15310 [Rheinheimera aquimaris]|uniref:Uncharacterized protein n=1 Tax=Rheinheimera aquimaris TaxID=412437 RepID=A0ABN1DP59_9GAMM|nr:hypothetical protein [Rheinheimera aquimaris]MCB5213375.1 hypothetical protein [Rheinheimera aquimaris]
MATEWIYVVDTAVKIGLGALISGIAAYQVTRLKNQHESEKSKSTVIKDLILEAAKSADEYFDYTYRYFSKLDGIRISSEKFEFTDDDWKEAEKIINEIDSELTVARTNYYNAQSKLELLGLSQQAELLSTYSSGAEKLRKFYFADGRSVPTKEFLGEWCKKYVPIKKEFRESLSESFLGSI